MASARAAARWPPRSVAAPPGGPLVGGLATASVRVSLDPIDADVSIATPLIRALRRPIESPAARGASRLAQHFEGSAPRARFYAPRALADLARQNRNPIVVAQVWQRMLGAGEGAPGPSTLSATVAAFSEQASPARVISAAGRHPRAHGQAMQQALGHPDAATWAMGARWMVYAPAAGAHGVVERDQPLIGREREQAELADAAARAAAGAGGLVLVAGDAGVGKSRLVEAVVAASGLSVLRGDARQAAGAPYAPVAAALGEPLERRLGRRAVGYLDRAGLSRRELQVLRLVSVGRTNRAIGRELFLSPRTVEMYVSNIFAKLESASRAEAIHRAHELRPLPTA